MKINEIKPMNRPIEKMLSTGPESLSNEELLAIIIYTGVKGKSSLDLSYEIINSVNDIKDILNLSLQELMNFQGIKKTKACRIEASIELTRRLMSYKRQEEAFISHQETAKFIYPLLYGYPNEKLMVLYLNNRCCLIRKELQSGSSARVSIDFNEIIKSCIKYNARGVIISHNHPSGNPKPSKDDYEITEELSIKLQEFNLILFDHIIIGSNRYYSFDENDEFSLNLNSNE